MKKDGQTADEAVRVTAYLLSEKAGHPAGMETYFWREAELIVASEKAAPSKRLAAKGKVKAGSAPKPAAESTKKKSKKKR